MILQLHGLHLVNVFHGEWFLGSYWGVVLRFILQIVRPIYIYIEVFACSYGFAFLVVVCVFVLDSWYDIMKFC